MINTTSKVRETISNFNDHIRKEGGRYQDWYVGIATNPKDRLFNDHGVRQHGDSWIHSDDLGSDTAARRVESHFLDLGCEGGDGGGDRMTRFAYAYKMKAHTRP